MSAQKNTLFNYFGKSPAAKPSPGAGSSLGTPKASKVTDSPSTTPKRALASAARGGAQDSPKSTKTVVREHLVAASPRTRVQRKLLDAASSSPSVYEPHFLRNVLSPQNKVSRHYDSPQKNKENARKSLMSPVFKALKDHEESAIGSNSSPQEKCSANQYDVTISPSKCTLRRPVRNLNKEFVGSPSKRASEGQPDGKKVKNSEDSDTATVDVHAAFGQYVAAEMRRLNSEKAVRSLKHKIMKSILEVQSELEVEV